MRSSNGDAEVPMGVTPARRSGAPSPPSMLIDDQSLGGEIAVEVRRRDSAIHDEVATGDEGSLGSHEPVSAWEIGDAKVKRPGESYQPVAAMIDPLRFLPAIEPSLGAPGGSPQAITLPSAVATQ
jgi:hypothetical protein